MEHPFYGSWGYQTTGYFAPTSRYGTPQDFMYLVDICTSTESASSWTGCRRTSLPMNTDWDSSMELISTSTLIPKRASIPTGTASSSTTGGMKCGAFLSAVPYSGWINIMPMACALMLLPPCSIWTTPVRDGEWIPNKYGGKENLEAIAFLRLFNEEVYKNYPDVQTIAEESTAWPMVSRPTYVGGLGFG